MENGSGSSSNQNQNKKKGGKRKIPMELIEKEDYRQVCFSKRRKGLFKKAEELSLLCGVNVKIVAFSPAGNPYFYTSPNCSSSSTLDHLFPTSTSTSTDRQTQTDHQGDASEMECPDSISVLSRQASELRARLEASKRKNESLEAAIHKVTSEESVWSSDLANADLAQLLKLKSELEQIRDVAFMPVP